MTAEPQPGTAHDWLVRHARHRPDAVALTCLDGDAVRRLSYRQLHALVASVAAALPALGARPGDRIVLVLPNDESFAAVLLAAVGRGIVPVPAPTPATTRTEAFGRRLRGIVADCRPALVLTTASWRDAIRTALGDLDVPGGVHSWPDRAVRDTGAHPPDAPGSDTPVFAPDAPAFLQYTSGSTGSPKGVVISHRALHAACAQAALVYGEGPEDVAVTWVPLHHDMGLVTGVLRPLFSGYASVLMPSEAFARRPGAWLSAITAHGGTLSSAPDFAYALCARKVTDRELAALDLRTWRVARSAGEVVRATTAERFTARFSAAGFSPRSLCPPTAWRRPPSPSPPAPRVARRSGWPCAPTPCGRGRWFRPRRGHPPPSCSPRERRCPAPRCGCATRPPGRTTARASGTSSSAGRSCSAATGRRRTARPGGTRPGTGGSPMTATCSSSAGPMTYSSTTAGTSTRRTSSRPVRTCRACGPGAAPPSVSRTGNPAAGCAWSRRWRTAPACPRPSRWPPRCGGGWRSPSTCTSPRSSSCPGAGCP